MSAASIIALAEGWLAIGAIVAAVFLVFGLDRVEPNAKGGYVFRILILPGLVLLWPIVLWRWRMAEKKSEDWRNRHSPQRARAGWLGFGMAFGIFAILLVAITMRPDVTPPAPEKIGVLPTVGLS